MTEHITPEEYRKLKSKPKRSRERNVRTEYNGRIYDSKIEAGYAAELDVRKRAVNIFNWVPQVSIPLPGGVRCVIDFMIIDTTCFDGATSVMFEDVKAFDRKSGKARVSQTAKNKYKQLKELYGIEVKIIARKR